MNILGRVGRAVAIAALTYAAPYVATAQPANGPRTLGLFLGRVRCGFGAARLIVLIIGRLLGLGFGYFFVVLLRSAT